MHQSITHRAHRFPFALPFVYVYVRIQHMYIRNILHCHLQVVLHDPLGEIIPHYFTTDTSLSLSSLRPSTSYTFSVRTHNGEGVGPYCNEPITFTTNSNSGKYTCECLYNITKHMISYLCACVILMYMLIYVVCMAM